MGALPLIDKLSMGDSRGLKRLSHYGGAACTGSKGVNTSGDSSCLHPPYILPMNSRMVMQPYVTIVDTASLLVEHSQIIPGSRCNWPSSAGDAHLGRFGG